MQSHGARDSTRAVKKDRDQFCTDAADPARLNSRQRRDRLSIARPPPYSHSARGSVIAPYVGALFFTSGGDRRVKFGGQHAHFFWLLSRKNESLSQRRCRSSEHGPAVRRRRAARRLSLHCEKLVGAGRQDRTKTSNQAANAYRLSRRAGSDAFVKTPATTKKTFDALHRSIKRADVAAVRNALNEGVSANLENRFGWTMLMLAASEGDTAIGEVLVSNGADTNKATNTGQTALSLAIVGGHVRFLKMLLAHRADPKRAGAVEKWLAVCRLAPDTEQVILAMFREHREKNSK